MTGWTDLVTTALLGTDRRPIPTPLPEPWEAHDLQDTDPAGQLLDLAAVHRAAARTGRAAVRLPEPPHPPGDQLPAAPALAQLILKRLLSRPEPTRIMLWLNGCVHHGLTVAPELWTPLADHLVHGDRYPAVTVSAAFGTRGVWFVSQNPAWSPLVSRLHPPAAITTKPVPARSDTPANRRALAAVRLTTDREGAHTLVIDPPAVDAEMRADGIAPDPPPRSRLGGGAYVVRQLIAAAGAHVWLDEWRQSPKMIVELVQQAVPQWQADLCAGWAAAAARDQHAGWAQALAELGYRGEHAAALYRLIPADQRYQILQQWARDHRPPEQIMDLLLSEQRPWPNAAVSLALQLLGSGTLSDPGADYAVAVGAHIPMDAYTLVLEATERYLSGDRRPALQQLMQARDAFAAVEQILQLRAEMERAFTANTDIDEAASGRTP